MSPGEKMSKGINLFAKGLSEYLNKVAEMICEVANRMVGLMPSYESLVLVRAKRSTDARKRKAYNIYRRTKSKRIRKKQFKIMEG